MILWTSTSRVNLKLLRLNKGDVVVYVYVAKNISLSDCALDSSEFILWRLVLPVPVSFHKVLPVYNQSIQ